MPKAPPLFAGDLEEKGKTVIFFRQPTESLGEPEADQLRLGSAERLSRAKEPGCFQVVARPESGETGGDDRLRVVGSPRVEQFDRSSVPAGPDGEECEPSLLFFPFGAGETAPGEQRLSEKELLLAPTHLLADLEDVPELIISRFEEMVRAHAEPAEGSPGDVDRFTGAGAENRKEERKKEQEKERGKENASG